MKQHWFDWGLARRIERHNFLILSITRKHVESLDYKGVVVDLGCGKAPYKDAILQSADEYIGVDWQNSMHDQGNVDVFADLTERLPFHKACADTVVSFNVLEHLPEPNTFLSECDRILKSDGQLHMIVPFLWHVHEEPFDFYRFTHHGLRYLLEKNGFYEIDIRPLTGFWQTWWLAFNYHTVRFERGAFKYFWYVIWWLTQMIASLLDKINSAEDKIHTSHYVISAKKMGSVS